MTDLRNSENKLNHNSGTTPFTHRADLLRNAGSEFPHCEAYFDAYKNDAPEVAVNILNWLIFLYIFANYTWSCHNTSNLFSQNRVKKAAEELVANRKANASDEDMGNRGPITLTLDDEIGILTTEAGPARGTRYPGIGALPERAKKRGRKTANSVTEELRAQMEKDQRENAELRQVVNSQAAELSDLKQQMKKVMEFMNNHSVTQS